MKTIHDLRYVRLINHFIARRRELGMTQEQVSKHLNVSRTWCGKVEQRERRLDCLETWLLVKLYRMDFQAVEAILSMEEKCP